MGHGLGYRIGQEGTNFAEVGAGGGLPPTPLEGPTEMKMFGSSNKAVVEKEHLPLTMFLMSFEGDICFV